MNNVVNKKCESVSDYLNYYLTLDNPGYAVLVTGEWGVGKTFQVKAIIKEDRMHYVSLFGVRSADEIYSSIFLKMFPLQANARKFLGSNSSSSIKLDAVTLPIGSLVGNIANTIFKEKVSNEKIIVFDDLERSNINKRVILSVVNKYIEHHGCKVLIIANDKEIFDDEFNKNKEKVIGQVLKVEAKIETAFEAFIKNSKIPLTISSFKKNIYDIFCMSGCQSLRILKYVINDVERLISNLEKKHIAHQGLLNELLTLFIALDIDFKRGLLSEEDLSERSNAYYLYVGNKSENGGGKRRILELEDHYKQQGKNIMIHSTILDNDVLIDCIINGFYDRDAILKSIDESPFFRPDNEVQPWFKIINFDETDTIQVKKALSEMEFKIENYLIQEPGEILHSFNLKFMLSTIGEVNETIEDILIQAKKYLCTLKNKELLPPAELDPHSIGATSAYGYGYWILDDYREQSSQLYNFLTKQRYYSLRRKYSTYIKTIIDSLQNNPVEFCKSISRTGSEYGQFAYIDVLGYIKPYLFVDLWLGCKIENWQSIRRALEARYEAGGLYNQLKKERQWIRDVKINLRHRASQHQGIDKLRIMRLIPK